MPQSTTPSVIRRAAGALLFAVVFWAIVSLSDQFNTTIEVPLRVELPSNQALTEPIPTLIRLTARASGWSLLKMIATGTAECVIYLPPGSSSEERIVGISRSRLMASIRTTIPDAQQISVAPDSLTLAIGPVDTKNVPISPEITINTRKGFQVIGSLRMSPDSVALTGAKKVLDYITVWPTEAVAIGDVHSPISRWVQISDTLHGIVTPQVKRTEIKADVQEVAERSFSDLQLINRGIVADTSLRLLLQPQRVEVLVRGGAGDLSRLDPSMLSAYVEIIEGVDTLGVAYPRLVIPPGLNITLVSIKPDRVRYFFRRNL